MIHELRPPQTQTMRSMFEPLSFQVSCGAVLDGVIPGRVLVDDAQDPTVGFVLTPEVACLAGNAGNTRFSSELRDYLEDARNLGLPMWRFPVVVSSGRWAERLVEIAGEKGVASLARRHYVYRRGDDLRSLPPPPGAVLKRIDARFMDSVACATPAHIGHWIRDNWGTLDHFLEAGFGVATICGPDVVAWSVADCASHAVCEIGIHTSPVWRRKGMGVFTTVGALQCALDVGMQVVGWHCHEDNVASRRTAERAGFKLERSYVEYCIRRPNGTSG
jgi:RimJ/RimL family protein N-acetyltransferase